MNPTGSTPINDARPSHGSSLRELGAPLDQERAASMADEGGAAGAITDAREQARVATQRDELAPVVRGRTRLVRVPPRAWPWVALAVSGVALAVFLWRRR